MFVRNPSAAEWRSCVLKTCGGGILGGELKKFNGQISSGLLFL